MNWTFRVFVVLFLAFPVFAQAPLVAEDQAPTGKFLNATEVKPILEATRANWVGVREWDGQDLVYVTHLWSWRCGLLQMQVSINGAPAQIWPMPPCRNDSPTPTAILEEDGLPFAAFPLQSVQTISVRLIYDDLSEDVSTFERNAVKIP